MRSSASLSIDGGRSVRSCGASFRAEVLLTGFGIKERKLLLND